MRIFSTGDTICIISFIPGMIGLLLVLIGLILLLVRAVRKKISGVQRPKKKAVKCIVIGIIFVVPLFIGIIYDENIQPVIDAAVFKSTRGPLLPAIERIDKSRVARLLEKGAAVNYVSWDGATPLTAACVIARRPDKLTKKQLDDIMEIIRLLIRFGADMELRPDEKIGRGQVTPSPKSIKYIDRAVQSRLDSHTTPLQGSIRYGNNDALVELLLESGADPNNGRTNSPLSIAVYYNMRYAEMLVRYGADVERALFYVCKDFHSYNELYIDDLPSVIWYLCVHFGADKNAVDAEGNRPYDIVKKQYLGDENAFPEKLKRCNDKGERQKLQEKFEEKRKIYEKTLALLQ